MKKIFISISAAFIFILSCIIPFTASAVYNNRPTTKEAFNYANFIRNTDSYIFMNFDNNDNNDTCACLIRIPNSVVNNTDYVSINDNVYIINCPSNMFQMCIETTYVNKSEYNLSYIKLDFNTNTVEFKFYNNGQLTTPSAVYNAPYYGMNEYQFYNYESDINTNFQAIEVELFPDLDLNFDYTAEFMGDTYPMQLLQVDIINNTSNNYQYAILVQPEGAGFDTEVHGNSKNKMIFWGESNITYALMRDEWCYMPGDGRTTSNSGWELYNTPSPWHFVGANEYKREQIYFDQMKLKKGQNYVFKVFAFDQSDLTFNGFFGLDTNNKVFSTGGSILDLVYTKTFSVVEDTEFNSNNYANGNYSFNPDAPLDTQFDKVKAVYDTSIADFKITDSGTYDSIYDSKPNKIDKYAFNDTKSINGTFDNLVTQSSSYFLLLLSVFNFFPAWFTALLFTGMLGIIIVFIIKKI